MSSVTEVEPGDLTVNPEFISSDYNRLWLWCERGLSSDGHPFIAGGAIIAMVHEGSSEYDTEVYVNNDSQHELVGDFLRRL